MKIAVRYQSQTGHNKQLAEAIAEIAGVQAEPVTQPLDEPVDVLFVGGGVYMMSVAPSLKRFLDNLDPSQVKNIAIFSSAGHVRTAINAISKIVKEKGINAFDETFFISVGISNPDSEQITQVKQFAENILKKLP